MGLLDKILRNRTGSRPPANGERTDTDSQSALHSGMPSVSDDYTDPDNSMAETVPAELTFDPELAQEEDFSEFGPSQFGDSSVAPLSAALPNGADAARTGENDRSAVRINPRPGTRVLIIDESFALISGLRRMMRQNKLEPIEAVGGERGLELAFSMAPELIFLAVAMPGLSGFNTLRALRRDPRTHDVPVIMMSANAQATEASYLKRMGADDFMVKPFSRGDVFLRIEKLLDSDLIPRRLAGDPSPSPDAPAPS